MLNQISTINWEDYPVQVLTAGHKHYRARHIQMGSDSPTADLFDSRPRLFVQCALAIQTGRASGYLRWKYSRCDRVDADVQLHPCNLCRKHLGHMDGGCLGRVARKVVKRRFDEAIDAADVDYAALVTRVLGIAAAGEEWEEGRRDEVVRGSVCAVDIRPVVKGGIGRVEEILSCLGRIFAYGLLRRAVYARIVYQEM